MPNYNTTFPVSYQSQDQPSLYYQPTTTTPMYQTRWPQQYQYNNAVPSYQQQNIQPVNNGSMIWVQGEAGAKAYSNLQPGIPVALWDSEEQVIYIKTIDQTGKPTMTILDYVDRNADSTKEEVHVDYVTKEQFDSISNQLNDLSGHVSDIENRISNFGGNQNQNNRRGNK